MAGDVVHVRIGRPRRRVVAALALSPDAAGRLSELLGAAFELIDIKVSEGDEDIVLVPSSSWQLTGKLRTAFPDAVILAVEVEDDVHGIEFGGQVLRTLDAGADSYFVARSIDELASIVGLASERLDSSEAREPVALTAGVADDLLSILDELLLARQDDDSPLRGAGAADVATAEPGASSPTPTRRPREARRSGH